MTPTVEYFMNLYAMVFFLNESLTYFFVHFWNTSIWPKFQKNNEKSENCTHLYEKYIGKCDLFNSVHFNSVLTIRRFVICFLYVAYFRCRCVRPCVCFFLLLATNSCPEKQLHKNVVFRFDDNSYTLGHKIQHRMYTNRKELPILFEWAFICTCGFSLKPKICWQNRIYFYIHGWKYGFWSNIYKCAQFLFSHLNWTYVIYCMKLSPSSPPLLNELHTVFLS